MHGAGLMMSRAGDIRCLGCALVDNMRAGAELNRMNAPYNTTGTVDGTLIAINTRAMQPFIVSDSTETEDGSATRRLRDTSAPPELPASGLPHSQRDDPDAGTSFGWCDIYSRVLSSVPMKQHDMNQNHAKT